MAEQIIDIRERIEKMRIKIDDEQVSEKSIKTDIANTENNFTQKSEEKSKKETLSYKKSNENNVLNLGDKSISSNGSFPNVSLSVKNPISTKILVFLMILQILSNLGILYLLYTLLE